MKDIMGRESVRKSRSREKVDQNPIELAFSAFVDKCILVSVVSEPTTSYSGEHHNKGERVT